MRNLTILFALCATLTIVATGCQSTIVEQPAVQARALSLADYSLPNDLNTDEYVILFLRSSTDEAGWRIYGPDINPYREVACSHTLPENNSLRWKVVEEFRVRQLDTMEAEEGGCKLRVWRENGRLFAEASSS